MSAILEREGLAVKVSLDGSLDASPFDLIAVGLACGDVRSAVARRLRGDGYLGAIVSVAETASEVPSLRDAGVDD